MQYLLGVGNIAIAATELINTFLNLSFQTKNLLLLKLQFLLLRRYLPRRDATDDLREGIDAGEIVLDEIDTTAFTDRYGGTMKAIAPATQGVRAAE